MPPFGPGPPSRPCRPFYRQVDESEIRLDSVSLKLNRSNTLRLPFEVSLIIPRAEIRRRWYQGGQLFQEEEYKLSGITLVHSPRYPHRPGLFPGGRPEGPAFPESTPTPAPAPAQTLPPPHEQLPASGYGEAGGGGPAPPGKKVPPAWTLPPGEPVPPGQRAVPGEQFPSVQPDDGPATPAKPAQPGYRSGVSLSPQPARPVQPPPPDAPTRSRQPAPPAPEQDSDAEAVPPARPFTQPHSALPAGFAAPPAQPWSAGIYAQPLPPAPPAPPGQTAPPPPLAPPGSLRHPGSPLPSPRRAPRISIITRRGKEQEKE